MIFVLLTEESFVMDVQIVLGILMYMIDIACLFLLIQIII